MRQEEAAPLAEKEASMLVKGMTGDTPLMLKVIFRDIEQGVGVCFFDSEGEATKAILARVPEEVLPRVFLLDPVDEDFCFGLNLFECDASDGEQVANTVTTCVQLFSRLVTAGEYPSLSSPMEDLLRAVAHTMIANSGRTMRDIPLLLTDAMVRQRLVKNVGDPQSRLFWDAFHQLDPPEQQARTQLLVNSVLKLLENPFVRQIVGQVKTTVDFSELLETGSILLVRLPQAEWQLSCIVCYTILAQFVNAVYARRHAQKQAGPEPFRFYANGFTWQHLMLQQG